eukprot:jgi/Ulvmu1/9051/UM005_0144.1
MMECSIATPPRQGFTTSRSFIIVITGSIVCSTIYTLLQELLFRQTEFTAHGWLTFITFVVYTMMAVAEMLLCGRTLQLRRSLVIYLVISAFSMLATYITNVALHHIPYSVKIVAKSCRIVPVMLFSVLLQGASYSSQEVSAAAVLVVGVILFVKGDPSLDTLQAKPIHASGLSMLLLAVAVDALVANLEEKYLFRVHPAASRTEAIAFLSFFASVFSFMTLIASGEVSEIHVHSQSAISDPKICITIILSAVAGYGAMSFMLLLISMYGVTTTELVKTVRKVLNVVFSFLFFPKPLTWLHCIGGLLVLCGLSHFSKKKVKAKATPKAADVESGPFQMWDLSMATGDHHLLALARDKMIDAGRT